MSAILYDYARKPEIDEIIIVPLANPSGAYIRMDGNDKIPILGKVRSVFSSTVNIVNIFGYIYNVPISHTELFNFELSDKYYSDMVTNAWNILNQIGYPIQNNDEFFRSQQKYITYIDQYQPRYKSPSQSLKINIANINTSIINEYNKSDYIFGEIKVIAMGLDSLLHYIEKTKTDVLYDPDTGELLIQGYGLFSIDSSYSYMKNQTNYVIFKSYRNYFHVKQKRVKKVKSDSNSYTIPLKLTKTEYGYYEVQTIRPKQHKSQHQKYIDVIAKIKKESL